MKKVYCENCDKQVDYILKPVKREYKVKDDVVAVEINEAYCAICGKRLFVFKVERENQIRVYDAYKIKHKLLTSNDIIEIRKRHHLSQKDLARKIRIGEKNIARYENGAIQDQSINLLILFYDKFPELFDRDLNCSYTELKNIDTYYCDSEQKIETNFNNNKKNKKLLKGAYCNA